MILRASRAMAAAEERDYVIPDDVKALAVPSLAHRIIVTADAVMSGRSPRGHPGGDPLGGSGPGRGDPLMPSGRGVAVLFAGLAMWLAARIIGSPGPRGDRASDSPRLPAIAAIFVRWGHQRIAVHRRLSDIRVSPGTRVTVHIDIENRSAAATSFLLLEDGSPPSWAARPGWSSRGSRRTAPKRSRTPSCRRSRGRYQLGPAHGGRVGSVRPGTSATRVRRT